MKIRVLSFSRLDSYLYEHDMEDRFEDGYDTMTDEEFRQLNEEIEGGWGFNSWAEFVANFNEDTNLAPMPSEHILRVFPND
jgi:hypothetical protein